MIKAPVRLIRLTYPERDLLLKKLQQFGEDPDAFYLLQKLGNQTSNLLLTDEEIDAVLEKLSMLRKDTDAQYLGEKISNLQTQLPSDVQAKISFVPITLLKKDKEFFEAVDKNHEDFLKSFTK